MKQLILVALSMVILAPCLAQRSISDFGKGSVTDSGVQTTGGNKPEPTQVVTRERLLTKDRDWQAADGRIVKGALVSHQPGASESETKITPIRDGIVRLKIGDNIFALKLDKLSKQDQEFITELDQAFNPIKSESKAPNPSSPQAPAK